MRRIRPLAAIAAAAIAATLAVVPAAGASAASRDGWVRLAHMSPDTAAVNITLSSLTGDVTLFRLKNVGYGAISKYMRLPQGTYALAMVPSGKGADATPIVKGSVSVAAGEAETIAAIGLNKDLKTKSFSDDIGAVSGDDARVRIVQASVTHDSVDVSRGSSSIASDAAFGDVSKYRTVSAGSARLTLKDGTDSETAAADFSAGSTHTLFVIDDAKGDLTVASTLDSASATETPVGGVATGGGGLAQDDAGLAALLAVVLGLAGAGAAVGVVRRPTRPSRA